MKHFYIKGLQIFLLISGCLLASFRGVAQYTPSILGTGENYSAVATDRQNRVYVVAYNAGTNKYEVQQYVAGSTGAHTTVYGDLAGTSIERPWGIAVNSHGDIYVTNPNTTNGWEIIKLAAGTFTPSVIQSGKYYTAITTDANDNLLTMEYDGTANYQVVKYTAGAGETLPGTVLYNGIPIAPGAGSYPWGIVTDKQNNIYILDLPTSSTQGKLIKLTAPGYAPTTLASGKYYSSLAIDAAGNLYTSELASGTTFHVMKYAAPTLSSGTEIYTGLSVGNQLYPWGLAVDSKGNVFVNDAAAAGDGKFIKLTSDAVSVVSVLRTSPNPTGASTVDYKVTFSAPVYNVTATAFSITTTGGISGSPHTTSVTGSGTTYNVTVNTGTGNGTLQLGVNAIGVMNNFDNIPYSTGEVYTIVRTTVPTGSFTINGGAAYTSDPAVNLAITSANANEMHFANDGDVYTAYEPIAATKSFTLSAGDGSKLVHMQLKDAAGNEPVFDASIILDQTPPGTDIVTKPPPVTNSSIANFAFTSTESNSIYEVSLDGGIYTLASTPATFSGFGSGTHSVSVRAIDQAGNADPTPALYSWIVDKIPPVVTSVAVPANGYYTSGNVLNFKVNFNENAVVNTTGGTPYIDVTIGTVTRHATYTGGSGTAALSFSYTVQSGEMDMDGIALGTALTLGGGTIRDAAGNDAVLTLNSVGSTAAVFVNTGTAGVTLSTTATSPVNQPFTATATFTEAVTGLTLGDIVGTNATLSNLLTTDNITYTVLVTPAADGAVSLQIPAGAAVNIGNNGNSASNTLNLTYDGTAPAVTSVDVPANGTYKSGDVLSFAVHYAENVTVTGTPSLDVVVGSQTRQAVYNSGGHTNMISFSYTVQDGDLDIDGIALGANITLNTGTITDAAGNNALLPLNNVANTTAVLVDAAAPAVTSVAVPANGYYTSGNVLNFTVNFNENAVVNTTGGTPYIDVTIGTVTRHATYTGGSGTAALSFSYTVQPGEMDMDGIAPGTALTLDGGTIRDAAGNDAVLTLNSVGSTAAVFVNTGTAGVTLSTTATSPVNQPFTATATFTEAVTGLTLGDIVGTNATLSNLLTTDNITYTVLVTPAADGAVSLQIPAGAAVNIGNNGNSASNTLNLTYDGTAPAVTSVDVPANGTYKSGDVLSFAVHYAENVTVTGTPSLDVVVGSQTRQAVYSSGSHTNMISFSYTVQDGDLDIDGIALGANITLNTGTITDAAGNNALLPLNNVANTTAVLVDAAAPVVTSVAVPANGYYTSGNVLNFTVNFNENAVVNTTGGTPYIDVTIGTVTRHATYTGGSGTAALSFSYTVQPGEMDMDGIAPGTALTLDGGTIRDAAGNDAVLTLNSVGSTAAVFVNTGTAGVTLSTTATSPVNQPFTATATFTEAVTGLTLGDIVGTNATLSNLLTTDNITYTVLVTPAADGAVSLQIPAGAAVNIGNNGNSASNTLNLTYDGTAPAVTSVDVPANGVYTTAGVLSFTVHFAENVTVSGTPDLSVIIGTVAKQAVYTGGSGSNALAFSYTVQNGDMDMDGITLGAALALNNGTIADAAGNNALLALNNVSSTANVLVNTAIPGVTISTTAVSPVNQPFTATITFTEAVTGFTQSDIVATNAALSNLQATGNTTYTVLVTPTTDGAVSINVPAGVAVNIGNNGNTASNTLSLTYDGTAPVVTSVDVPADGVYTNGEALSFTVHYSENVNVSGTPSMDIIIGAATKQAAYTGGSGASALTFSYTVQNGDMDMDGIVLGASVNGTIRDATGNNAAPAINHAGSTTGVLVNTQHPSVTLSSGAASRINTPVTVNITFSEAVTGFTAAGISASNATVSKLQTADNITYTATVTPVADGGTSISVPAGTAVNIGGNGNTASNTLSFTYDGTAPVISQQTFEIKGDSPAGTAVGKLNATDAGGALQSWTITTDGSGGAFAIDGSGNITVKDAAILKSKAGTTVSVTVTVSDGLNTSAPAQVTINILSLFVNKAPTLDEIADESNCAGTDVHTIQLTGMSAADPGQTYTLTVAADQAYFDELTVSAAGALSYKLKPDVTSGTANVTVTIKDNGGTDNGGADARQRTFSVTVNSLPAVSISSDKGNTVSKGDAIRLTATGGGTYNWAPADGIISGQQSAVLQVRTMANTTYEVTVTNAAGCSNTGSISISTIADFKVEATNIVSPNGDGRNDKWVIRNLDSYPDNEVKIFDRTGRMVYQRRNYSNDWDGTMNGKPLAEGTYYYILTIDGNAKTAKGYITIIRAQ